MNKIKLFPSNLHTHTFYCDGRNSAEEYIEEAIKKGLVSLGFSGHSYLAFDKDYCMSPEGTKEYCHHILFLKEKYKEWIEVYLGIEADYFSGIGVDQAKEMQLDYRIGSVHYVTNDTNNKFHCVDNTLKHIQEGIEEIGDVRLFVAKYYENICKMTVEQKPDIIGHLDLIRKLNHNNCLFNEDETWYKDILDKTTDIIAKSDAIVEINTGGIARAYTTFPYPAYFILEMIKDKNIPITINSDAHQVSHLTYHFEETVECLGKIGFKEVKILKGGQFTSLTL